MMSSLLRLDGLGFQVDHRIMMRFTLELTKYNAATHAAWNTAPRMARARPEPYWWDVTGLFSTDVYTMTLKVFRNTARWRVGEGRGGGGRHRLGFGTQAGLRLGHHQS